MTKNLIAKIDQEHLLLAFFLIPTGYMFVESYSFSSEVGIFPRLSAMGVIVFTLLLISRKYIPDNIASEVNEPNFDDYISKNKFSIKGEEDGAEEGSIKKSKIQKNSKRGIKLSVWTGTYLFTSYLFGFFWTTPIFVLIYGQMRNLSVIETLALSAISIIIAYSFMTVTRVPIDEGVVSLDILTI